MTYWLSGQELNRLLDGSAVAAFEEVDESAAWVRPDQWHEVARVMKETPSLQFDYLNAVTAVDYIEYFEVIYHLTSLQFNHAGIVKARCWGRDEPKIPSVMDIWKGADLQEREVYDLMGIVFTGRPSLKRLLLWEGFHGHPLRRDYEEVPLPYTWPPGG